MKPLFGSGFCRRSGDRSGRGYGQNAQFRSGRWRGGHSKKARFPRIVDGSVFAGTLDPDFDIAALQLKLGNILFDEELDEFFQLFFFYFCTVGQFATSTVSTQTRGEAGRGAFARLKTKKTILPKNPYWSGSSPHTQSW